MPVAVLIPLIMQLLTEAPTIFADAKALAQAIGLFHTTGIAPQPQEKIDAMHAAVAASLSSQQAARAAAGMPVAPA